MHQAEISTNASKRHHTEKAAAECRITHDRATITVLQEKVVLLPGRNNYVDPGDYGYDLSLGREALGTPSNCSGCQARVRDRRHRCGQDCDWEEKLHLDDLSYLFWVRKTVMKRI